MTQTAEAAPVAVEPANLTAQDRCDRCGAQAIHLAEMPDGLELLFCNHDFEIHEPKLAEIGARVKSDEVLA
jgi:hypothetical protein